MADVGTLRDRNVEFWSQAAPGWIRHADLHDSLGAPLGEAALAALAPTPGERVLDVGCGCGGTTAVIAKAVGQSGLAVGVDLSEAMISIARSRAPMAGFVAADIELAQHIEGEPFDAAYSRMALMVFADPVAGTAAIRRSLRPGGRLAATVFRGPDASPWLAAAVLGAAPHVGSLPAMPLGSEPGPFAFADPERARRALSAGGFVDVRLDPVDTAIDAPDKPDVVAEWLIEVGPAGAAYRESDADARSAARTGVARLLRPFQKPGGGYRLPSGLWLITAGVPG